MRILLTLLLTCLFCFDVASANLSTQCGSRKIAAGEKAAVCMARSAAKGIRLGSETPLAEISTRCEPRYNRSVSFAESRGQELCPTQGDGVAIFDGLSQCVESLVANLGNDSPLPFGTDPSCASKRIKRFGRTLRCLMKKSRSPLRDWSELPAEKIESCSRVLESGFERIGRSCTDAANLPVAVQAALTCAQTAIDGVAIAPLDFSLPALHAEPDVVNGGRIVDSEGSEVLLRGVNLNSFGEYYAFDPTLETVFPFTEDDAIRMRSIGWNVVRLILSWSKVEPQPGVYDASYLTEIENAIRLLEDNGLYTIIDLHQDAWGPTLVAGENEICPEPTIPAVGWDGAPGWATLDLGKPRCEPFDLREFSLAVLHSFNSFWNDVVGPGGVGIQTRYHSMLQHLAERFSSMQAVIGYDVMNEPNAWGPLILSLAASGEGFSDQHPALANFYERALVAVRAGETSVGASRKLFLFEPSPDWALELEAAVPPVFVHDDQIVYAPHIYQGGIVPNALELQSFQLAVDEAVPFGGAPILTGEWGADPARVISDPINGFECPAPFSDMPNYFDCHQAFQDQFRMGATLWVWQAACGDPHYAGEIPAPGPAPYIWGLEEVDCHVNQKLGRRVGFENALRRPVVRSAPGAIQNLSWDPVSKKMAISAVSADVGGKLLIFLPEMIPVNKIHVTAIDELSFKPTIGPGGFLKGVVSGSNWSVQINP